MNKNILNKIIITLIIFFLILLMYKLNQKEEKTYFKKVELANLKTIVNRTDKQYLDTIIAVGLNILNIKDIKVLILPLNEGQKKSLGSDFELRAHVRAAGNFYYIWIDNMGKVEAIEVISHELIHVEQYYKGVLAFDDFKVTWEGQDYDLNDLTYNMRPWEIDAYSKETLLKSKIISKLY